jgi:transcriptional regulator with XRE-family HTH domain
MCPAPVVETARPPRDVGLGIDLLDWRSRLCGLLRNYNTSAGHCLAPFSLDSRVRSRAFWSLRHCRVIDQRAIFLGMPRPQNPPHLVPRQPKTQLGLTMQKLRLVNRWTGKQVAETFGCSPSHISRVEQGSKPSRQLVQFYEDTFNADGLLLSLFEVAEHAPEQERRRNRGRPPQPISAIPGDASTFLGDTIPHGTLMTPSQKFNKTWRVRNSGTVRWVNRRLERQGPLTGPGLITSERYVVIPDTEPGQAAEITTTLKAPTYDCTSIGYFKMVHADSTLCFPDSYQLGLDVLVRVEGQRTPPGVCP